MRRKPCLVLGLDLAGVPQRPTGVCLLRGLSARTRILCTDEEIWDFTAECLPDLIAIDAPLTLPPGRGSIHERNQVHYRTCDLELRKRKIPFFPITLGPMRGLTERGIALRRKLERAGMKVIEIYPGGAQDIWKIPRAKRDLDALRSGLERLGIRGLRHDASAHELDAATGAHVGRLFLRGEAEVYGDFSTGAIVMPYFLPG